MGAEPGSGLSIRKCIMEKHVTGRSSDTRKMDDVCKYDTVHLNASRRVFFCPSTFSNISFSFASLICYKSLCYRQVRQTVLSIMATPNGSGAPRSSSPLHFPSSSVAGTPRVSRLRNGDARELSPLAESLAMPVGRVMLQWHRGLIHTAPSSSPLHFPSSSPRQPNASRSGAAGRPAPSSSGMRVRGNTPLFFPT